MAKSNSNTKLEFSVVASMVAVTLISGAMLSSMRTNADTDAVDEVNITVPSACTMSGNIATGQEHTASINPNTYQDNIGKTTITAFCNDSGGYAIYAIGFTGDKYDGEDHTKLIGTNTGQKIITGTAKTGSSQWAMRITPATGTYAPTIENDFDSTDYHVIPDTYTKVATYGSTTDAEGGTGSSIETTYAAYISGTQAADTYTGKVKYTLVHPASEPAPITPQTTQTGKIRYYANVSDYEGTMADQDIAASVTLLPSNFSRTGYGFAGWSDKFDYATNPEAKFYGPMETITLNTADYTGTNPGLSLYAVWVKSQGSLQDTTKTANVCNSLTTAPIDGTANLSSVSALTDERDNNTYAIAKLADGKCWMIENLRLANKDSNNNDIELSSTNTNNPSLPLTNNYAESTTSNHLSASINPTTTAWCTSASAACHDQSMLYTGNTTERGSSPATPANTYSYGNYYNWYSATAGHGVYTKTSGSVTGDICPLGWRLPTGKDSGEFYILNTAINSDSTDSTASNRLRAYPNNFLYSGHISSSSLYRGSHGDYYSSSASSNSMYRYVAYFYLDNSHVLTSSMNAYRDQGRSIRCITNP